MIQQINLPELGENITSADVVKILVKAGDKIEVNQVLMEIETDKANVELPSEFSGTVKEVYVKEGTKVKTGEHIFTIDTSSEKSIAAEEQKKITVGENIKTESAKTDTVNEVSEVEYKLPELGENISSATITKVLVKAGDRISVDQILFEIETDKATVEIPSEISGTVKQVKVKDGQTIKAGEVVLIVSSSNAVKSNTANPTKAIEPEKQAISDDAKLEIARTLKDFKNESTANKFGIRRTEIIERIVPASPSVRRFAREIGIDIHKVKGTGTGGRISIDDVKLFAKELNQKIQKAGIQTDSVSVNKEPLPDFSKFGEIERMPMNNVRRKTAEHLSYAWSTVPHVTQFDKADITELEKLRKQFSKQVETAGGKLTITGILLKVIASAMKVFPQFNSSVDMDKSEIIYKKYINIGVAVDTEKGLLVPVIKDADRKNITKLCVELAEISKKARDKKLGLDDMQGGCFTISNLGGIGGTYFTPVVNSPEVAILGVSKSSVEPVFIDGEFKPRLMMPLSLSYDHRIIDGADAIRFLRWIINALENPFVLSLEA
jgi:pyruvate dehydrogenase E2 component (dihydrolipoamide acetyltransferase)